MKRGICTRDKTLVRRRMLCEIGYSGYVPNNTEQRKLDRIASPIHADLTMRDDAQCSNCKFYREDSEYKEEIKMTELSEVKCLTCCVCGEATEGRQWHNRDWGYGLCPKCAEFVKTKQTPEENHSYYGIEGVHYKVEVVK